MFSLFLQPYQTVLGYFMPRGLVSIHNLCVVIFRTLLYDSNNLHAVVWFQVFISNSNVIWSYANSHLHIHMHIQAEWITSTQWFIVTFVCERELETEHNCNILTPTLMAVSVVSFSFSRAAQPEAQGPSSLLNDNFLYCILSPTGLVPNSSGAPRAPSAWRGFPYHISSLTTTDL